MNDHILKTVCAVIRSVFDAPAGDLGRDLRFEDLEGWSSIKQIELMVCLESALNVRYTLSEVRSIGTLGDLVTFLAGKTSTQNLQ